MHAHRRKSIWEGFLVWALQGCRGGGTEGIHRGADSPGGEAYSSFIQQMSMEHLLSCISDIIQILTGGAPQGKHSAEQQNQVWGATMGGMGSPRRDPSPGKGEEPCCSQRGTNKVTVILRRKSYEHSVTEEISPSRNDSQKAFLSREAAFNKGLEHE